MKIEVQGNTLSIDRELLEIMAKTSASKKQAIRVLLTLLGLDHRKTDVNILPGEDK